MKRTYTCDISTVRELIWNTPFYNGVCSVIIHFPNVIVGVQTQAKMNKDLQWYI